MGILLLKFYTARLITKFFFPFFTKQARFPLVSPRICSALFVENMRPQITLYERKRASFVGEDLRWK